MELFYLNYVSPMHIAVENALTFDMNASGTLIACNIAFSKFIASFITSLIWQLSNNGESELFIISAEIVLSCLSLAVISKKAYREYKTKREFNKTLKLLKQKEAN